MLIVPKDAKQECIVGWSSLIRSRIELRHHPDIVPSTSTIAFLAVRAAVRVSSAASLVSTAANWVFQSPHRPTLRPPRLLHLLPRVAKSGLVSTRSCPTLCTLSADLDNSYLRTRISILEIDRWSLPSCTTGKDRHRRMNGILSGGAYVDIWVIVGFRMVFQTYAEHVQRIIQPDKTSKGK